MRAFLLAFLLVPGAAAAPLLVAVVPDLPGSAVGDEGFAVGSTEAFDLTGWSVTDGEGTWSFPAGTRLAAGVPLWVVGNVAAWQAHDGPSPWLDAGPSSLRLANAGDDLALLDPTGRTVDSFVWGDGQAFDPPQSPGLVLQRRTTTSGWLDTESPVDWRTPRTHRIGESRLDRPTFQADRLTLYASPDSSHAVLTTLIAGARDRLHLHVYELRSMDLVDALVAAKDAHPSLDLQVLVDGNPVGMTLAERHGSADALRRIQAVGGRAVLAGNGRYDDHHLKVLVADDAVAVQSENWVPSGVPADRSWGNRGWGVVVHHAEAADWFAAWMQADRDAWDAAEFDLASFDPTFTPPLRASARSGPYGPAVTPRMVPGPIAVTPIVSPDHTFDPASDPVAAVAAAARHRLLVQQMDLSLRARNTLGWASSDPLTDAVVAATLAGTDVRVLAAAPFAADDTGNADALAWLRDRGVEGRVLDREGLSTLHNKGLVADGVVVVGSMNGNHHSRSENREVVLLVESSVAADYFTALFEADWGAPRPPRDWSVPGQDLRGLPVAPWPTLLALAAVVWIRRWS
jgi:cardiolipin synthase A/B